MRCCGHCASCSKSTTKQLAAVAGIYLPLPPFNSHWDHPPLVIETPLPFPYPFPYPYHPFTHSIGSSTHRAGRPFMACDWQMWMVDRDRDMDRGKGRSSRGFCGLWIGPLRSFALQSVCYPGYGTAGRLSCQRGRGRKSATNMICTLRCFGCI